MSEVSESLDSTQSSAGNTDPDETSLNGYSVPPDQPATDAWWSLCDVLQSSKDLKEEVNDTGAVSANRNDCRPP